MIKNNDKKAFTLVEVMILLLGLAIILAATMPVITKLHNAVPLKIPHGKYICYRDSNNIIHEMLYKENSLVYEKVVTEDHCTFKPMQKAPYFLVYAVGGGAGGGHPGALTDRRYTNTEGNVNVLTPTTTKPSWLSTTDYVDNSGGTFKVTIPAVSGGKGGSTSYTGGEPPVPYTVNGGTGGTAPVKEQVFPITYDTYTISDQVNPKIGKNGTNDDSTIDGINTDTGGTPCTKGKITISYASTTTLVEQTGTCNGGSEGSRMPVCNNCITTGESGSEVSIVIEPYNLPYKQHFYEKQWKYGEGGGAGLLGQTFISTIDTNGVPIRPGFGGEPGTLASPNGKLPEGDLGITYFGDMAKPIVIGPAAIEGGIGNKSTSWIKLDEAVLNATTFLTKVGTWYVRYGEDGKTTVMTDLNVISGLQAKVGEFSRTFGQGGAGGGTYSSCNSSSITNEFNGVEISSTADACAADTGIYYQQTLKNGDATTSIAQHGYGGAVIVIW